jgi:hypothetical protein
MYKYSYDFFFFFFFFLHASGVTRRRRVLGRRRHARRNIFPERRAVVRFRGGRFSSLDFFLLAL